MVIISADWVNLVGFLMPIGFLMPKFKGFELKCFKLKRLELINAGKNLPHFFIFKWLK